MNERSLLRSWKRVRIAGCVVMVAIIVAGCGGGGDDDACAPDPREAANASCRVLVGICPHRGGDLIHDVCADALPRPGNVAWDGRFLTNDELRATIDLNNPPKGRAGQGCDVSLGGREFDALSWDSQQQHPWVWEVKTWTWSNRDDHARQCELDRAIEQFIKDCNIVVGCNKGISDPAYRIHYAFAASDQPLQSALADYFVMHSDTLPDGAAEFCSIEMAQGCR